MDKYLDEITIALYRVGDAAAIVHSYSGRPGVGQRLAWLARAMAVIGGMTPHGGDQRAVAFRCAWWHELAARRTFLEACKLDPSRVPEPRPLAVDDTRFAQRVEVEPLGGGAYRVSSVAIDPSAAGRGPAVAAGLAKLAELDTADDGLTVRFPCGAPHDELVGLLLPRAINVRAALREQEMTAGRGILVAPSAQQEAAT
jgi:hypothetical protein